MSGWVYDSLEPGAGATPVTLFHCGNCRNCSNNISWSNGSSWATTTTVTTTNSGADVPLAAIGPACHISLGAVFNKKDAAVLQSKIYWEMY